MVAFGIRRLDESRFKLRLFKNRKQENMKVNIPIIGALAPVALQKACSLNSSLPISASKRAIAEGYCLRGFMLTKLEVGEQICIFRTHRNGMEIPGFFHSSVIVNMQDELVIRTRNSLWIILPLDPQTPCRHNQNLLKMRIKGGSPVQCRLCGSIIRSTAARIHVSCACGLTHAPLQGTFLENLPPWAECSVANFVDPARLMPVKSDRGGHSRS
ncbi:MAG: hypothetical protein WEB60_06545 [Terrimicrobiaceae bacterium]